MSGFRFTRPWTMIRGQTRDEEDPDRSGPNRLACLSVDLDPIACYSAIHGLDAPPADAMGLVTKVAVPRFMALAHDLHIPITFFVVGSELSDHGAVDVLRTAVKASHELANHTATHPYRFLALDPERMREEVLSGQQALEQQTGATVSGFRAPGYSVTPQALALLRALGYRYDSSKLPSPPYYGAKALIMGAMALMRTPSRAMLHSPLTVAGPTGPYHPDPRHPWRRGTDELTELPVSVTPWLRVPIIGTTVVMAPSRLVTTLSKQTRMLPFVNFECHGIDLMDDRQQLIPRGLSDKQPDLRVPWPIKRRRLFRFLRDLSTTHRFSTLAQAADRIQ